MKKRKHKLHTFIEFVLGLQTKFPDRHVLDISLYNIYMRKVTARHRKILESMLKSSRLEEGLEM